MSFSEVSVVNGNVLKSLRTAIQDDMGERKEIR